MKITYPTCESEDVNRFAMIYQHGTAVSSGSASTITDASGHLGVAGTVILSAGADPSVWERLTTLGAIALPIVAVWQIVSLAGQEKRRDRERLKAAYVALWTEWATLSALQAQWAEADLFDVARSGALNPHELRPRDPSQFRQYLVHPNRSSMTYSGVMPRCERALAGYTSSGAAGGLRG